MRRRGPNFRVISKSVFPIHPIPARVATILCEKSKRRVWAKSRVNSLSDTVGGIGRLSMPSLDKASAMAITTADNSPFTRWYRAEYCGVDRFDDVILQSSPHDDRITKRSIYQRQQVLHVGISDQILVGIRDRGIDDFVEVHGADLTGTNRVKSRFAFTIPTSAGINTAWGLIPSEPKMVLSVQPLELQYGTKCMEMIV